jgi:hypothetical protein
MLTFLTIAVVLFSFTPSAWAEKPADLSVKTDSLSTTNQAPRIIAYFPRKMESAQINDEFNFKIKAIDKNHDSLHYLWKLNRMELSTEPKASFSFGSAGRFTLTALVSDGKLADSMQWIVDVAEEERALIRIRVVADKLKLPPSNVSPAYEGDDEIDDIDDINDPNAEYYRRFEEWDINKTKDNPAFFDSLYNNDDLNDNLDLQH